MIFRDKANELARRAALNVLDRARSRVEPKRIPPPIYDPSRSFRFSYDTTSAPVPVPTFRERAEQGIRRFAITAAIAFGSVAAIIIGMSAYDKPQPKKSVDPPKSAAFVSTPSAPSLKVEPEIEPGPIITPQRIRGATKPSHDCGRVWVNPYTNSHGHRVAGHWRKHPKSRWCP